LVTGGAGFIGSHVVERLISLGVDVAVVDNLTSGSKDFVPKDTRFYEEDIANRALETVFRRERPDVVVHLAARVEVGRSLEDPVGDARSNILGTVRLLDCCRKYRVRKIVYSSSCAVYGETEDTGILESAQVRPISFYGVSKYVPEMYIALFQRQFGLDYTILRYANVYGPRQGMKGEGGVVSIFIQAVKDNRKPVIYGDGEQTRDFVYVKDVAEANAAAIARGSNETINIGTGAATSINRLWRCIADVMNASTAPVYMPPRPGDIRHSRLIPDKAAELLGWRPNYDLERGIRETAAASNQ
jgi:UDP-glucose 4-epimerase